MPHFSAFPRPRALRWFPLFAVLAAVGAPCTADAARGGAYDGIWNVVFATTRGNCCSGYNVPFTVAGGRVSSAGGGRVSGSVVAAEALDVVVMIRFLRIREHR